MVILGLQFMTALMWRVKNCTSPYEKATEKYIKAHPKRVNYWVTGKID